MKVKGHHFEHLVNRLFSEAPGLFRTTNSLGLPSNKRYVSRHFRRSYLNVKTNKVGLSRSEETSKVEYACNFESVLMSFTHNYY